ncbi:hypothetical protein SeMB42_g03163 [Synchytrium endobioticum]|uniref:U3 small nucleolar RNA-associated protein 22 n=1 Tax=Synchytrium endobioticum TaxID=286115 RepID=A0A507D8M8_9FUNG|nr:hypothetical protein SeMB42_g03163 [Synchytrium endobioticum]
MPALTKKRPHPDLAHDDNDTQPTPHAHVLPSPSATKSSRKKKALVKPPSHDEIQLLRDTTDLFKSNLFKLQFEELLAEVRIKYHRMTTLDAMLHKLKAFFDMLSAREHVTLDEAISTLASDNVTIPFPCPVPSPDIKYKFAFKPPAKVAIVGSYLLKTVAKGKTLQSVDLAIQIPDEILTDRDHINYRYLYKRAFYLAVIAAELQKVKDDWSIQLKFCHSFDSRKPVLVISISGLPESDASSVFEIRIIPCTSPTIIPPARLAPARNSMHVYWQRHGPNGKGIGASSPSSYQVLRLAMQFIASNDFILKPWFLTHDAKPLSGVPEFSEEAFTTHFDVVIVDPSGRLNLAAQWSKHDLLEWHHEAKLSMNLFNDGTEDKFDALFLKNVEEGMLKFDLVATVSAMTMPLPIPRVDNGTDQPSQQAYLMSHLPSILREALGPRIHLVTARAAPLPSTSISQPLVKDEARPLHLGVHFDAEECLKAVCLGPDANDQTLSSKFTQLWGDKAEIRRFRDGSIKYAAVFEPDATGRSGILPRMIQYLIKRHVGVNASIWSTQLDVVLGSVHEDRPTSFTPVMEAFASLGKVLRDLEDLPLAVVSLIPIAPELRYTSVFIPTTSSPSYDSPMDIILQLESSSRWPDDFEAMHKFKVAFLIKLVESLAAVMPGTTAKVATPDANNLREGWADVTIPPGFTFRLWIQNERESFLWERLLVSPKLDIKQRNRLESAQARYTHRYHHQARHAALISNIATRFSAYPSITRLTKRWISAHLLSRCISDEVIELLCARVVTESYRGGMWSCPSSHLFGFMRVLWYIARYPWSTDPFIVELAQDGVTADVVNKAHEAFKANMASPSKKSMFVATEENADASWWSLVPNDMTLNRLVMLANAAFKVWDSCVKGLSPESELLKIFVTPTTGYDFIIRLDPTLLPRHGQNLTCDASLVTKKAKHQYKNLRALQSVQEDDWDPAERYAQELEEAFRDQAMFFHDRYGGDAVGVVFNTMTVAPGTFKVNTPFAITPSVSSDAKTKNHVAPSYVAMAAEMQRLGGGLVGYTRQDMSFQGGPGPGQSSSRMNDVLNKLMMGGLMGGSVGLCIGFLLGGYSTLRYGPGNRTYMAAIGRAMMQSAATFGFFMSIGTVIRSEDAYPPPPHSTRLFYLQRQRPVVVLPPRQHSSPY